MIFLETTVHWAVDASIFKLSASAAIALVAKTKSE
jgi:hypothetical protein